MLDRVRPTKDLRVLVEPLYIEHGMAPLAIARSLAHLGSHEQIERICANLRRNRRRAASKSRAGGCLDRTLNIAVSSEVYAALEPHALRRGLSVSRLAARIVDAGSDCVDAILDDGRLDPVTGQRECA